MNVDVLTKSARFFAGGRDRRGGPILTFPGEVDASAFSADDIISCLTYLSSIPR